MIVDIEACEQMMTEFSKEKNLFVVEEFCNKYEILEFNNQVDPVNQIFRSRLFSSKEINPLTGVNDEICVFKKKFPLLNFDNNLLFKLVLNHTKKTNNFSLVSSNDKNIVIRNIICDDSILSGTLKLITHKLLYIWIFLVLRELKCCVSCTGLTIGSIFCDFCKPESLNEQEHDCVMCHSRVKESEGFSYCRNKQHSIHRHCALEEINSRVNRSELVCSCIDCVVGICAAHQL